MVEQPPSRDDFLFLAPTLIHPHAHYQTHDAPIPGEEAKNPVHGVSSY